jgi:predicted RND superfamily exporter protein
MMWTAFRSFKLAVVALLPNLLPLFVVMGTMGWQSASVWPELKVNMGAAMIAAVSMGLAVDSSTHYIMAFQHLRTAGMTLREAFHATHQSAGRAMTFSTLALMVGFSALCWSEFVPTVYFGALMCLSMLGGLLGNLVLLPLLLSLVERDRPPPK